MLNPAQLADIKDRDPYLYETLTQIVAAVNGRNEIALAAILQALSKTLRLRLTLAHVNHGLRESAWQDEAVVLRVSAALGLPLKVTGLQLARRD